MPFFPENENEQKLERLIQQTLRDLPMRRAPGTLEHRIVVELERRAALPWWRKSYAHWPLLVRCTFLLSSAAVAKVAIMAAIWIVVGFETAPFTEAFAVQFAWVPALADLAGSVVDFCGAVLYSIPRFWLYGALACVVAGYVTLFGLGAFAYRAFFANRQLILK